MVVVLSAIVAQVDDAQAEDEATKLYQQMCGTCHVLPDTHTLTADMWKETLGRMAPMIRSFNEEQKAALLQYLQANAGTREQILQEEGRYYDRLCGSCHNRATIPATEKLGMELTGFLMDHVIEEADQDIDENEAHEAAEFLLHSSSWK